MGTPFNPTDADVDAYLKKKTSGGQSGAPFNPTDDEVNAYLAKANQPQAEAPKDRFSGLKIAREINSLPALARKQDMKKEALKRFLERNDTEPEKINQALENVNAFFPEGGGIEEGALSATRGTPEKPKGFYGFNTGLRFSLNKDDKLTTKSFSEIPETIGDALYSFANFGNIIPAGVAAGESLSNDKSLGENYEIEKLVSDLRKRRSPVASTLGEIASYIAPYSAGMKILSKAPIIGKGAAGASKFGEVLKTITRGGLVNPVIGQLQGHDLSEIPKDIAFGAGGEAVGQLLGAIPNAMQNVGPKLVNNALGTPTKELIGKNLGQEIVDRGLVGTERGLARKAQAALDSNENALQSLLLKASKEIPKPIPRAGAYVSAPEEASLEDLLDMALRSSKVRKPFSFSSSKEVIPERLSSIGLEDVVDPIQSGRVNHAAVTQPLKELKASFANTAGSENAVNRVQALIDEINAKGPLSLADANKVKRQLYKGLSNAYGPDVNPAFSKQLNKSYASGLKQGIEEGVGPELRPKVQQLNQELGFNKRLASVVAKDEAREAKRVLPLSLSDLGLSGAVGVGAGPMVGGGALLGKLLLNTPLGATVTAQGLKRTASALDKFGALIKLLGISSPTPIVEPLFRRE